MNKKLTYEEWRKQLAPSINVENKVRQQFSELFDADVNDELEKVFKSEYEYYLTQE